jgi:hypothetical protein
MCSPRSLSTVIIVAALACTALFEEAAYGTPQFVPACVLMLDRPICGLVWSDLEGDQANECACLLSDGSVVMCIPDLEWSSRLIHAAGDSSFGMWDRPTIDAGDLLSGYEGAEVAVLSHDKLFVLHRGSGNLWVPEILYDNTGIIGSCWGARVGDYDPGLPGEEVFAIFEWVLDQSCGVVYSGASGTWRDSLVYSAEVGMDSAAGEFDCDHEGPEIVIPTEMGLTYEVRPPPTTGLPDLGALPPAVCVGGRGLRCVDARGPRDLWPAWTIWIDMWHSGWVAEIGDVDAEHAGNEVAYGTRYSNSILVSSYESTACAARGRRELCRLDPGRHGLGQHSLDVAFTGETTTVPMNIWDIGLGDFLVESPGQEIAGVDESGNVYLVWRESGAWHGESIWTDPDGALNAVAACDADPSTPGDELLVGGVSGVLTVLSRTETGVSTGTRAEGTTVSLCPDPVRGHAIFTLTQPAPGPLELSIYDVSGRRLSTPFRQRCPAGTTSFRWSGTDHRGQRLPSGVYFARLLSSTGSATRKLVLVH